jgi:hypothetical protein
LPNIELIGCVHVGVVGYHPFHLRTCALSSSTRRAPLSSATPLICAVDDDASVADSMRYLIHSLVSQSQIFASAREFLSSRYVEEVR